MYLYVIIQIVRRAGSRFASRRTTVSLALPCRRRVGFSVRRAWPFFDIRILSRRPFWVARVERVRFTPFVIQVSSLRSQVFAISGLVWSGLVRFGLVVPRPFTTFARPSASLASSKDAKRLECGPFLKQINFNHSHQNAKKDNSLAYCAYLWQINCGSSLYPLCQKIDGYALNT